MAELLGLSPLNLLPGLCAEELSGRVRPFCSRGSSPQEISGHFDQQDHLQHPCWMGHPRMWITSDPNSLALEYPLPEV